MVIKLNVGEKEWFYLFKVNKTKAHKIDGKVIVPV